MVKRRKRNIKKKRIGKGFKRIDVKARKIDASTQFDTCTEQLSPFGGLLGLIKFFDLVKERDKTLLFRKRNIVESTLYVKKNWDTIYGVSGMRYDRKDCEWLQKEGSKCDHLLNRWELPHFGPILDGLIH